MWLASNVWEKQYCACGYSWIGFGARDRPPNGFFTGFVILARVSMREARPWH